MKCRRSSQEIAGWSGAGAVLLVFLLAWPAVAAERSDAELEALRAGFESRLETALARLSGGPFRPAEKRPPLKPGRGRYTRHYSYSVTDFAMKSFLLNEQIDAANAALAENCQFYVDNPLERNDRDSFYWASDVICRMVEFFGSRGSVAPGRMSPATEATVLEMAWRYSKDNSRLEDADVGRSKTWHIDNSENHHLQQFSTLWHFAKFLKDAPEYRDRRYDDGQRAAEHHAAWTEYTKEYLRERAKKGLFVEIASNGYGFQSLKCVYGFHDFAEDETLRRRTRMFLDLFWATWAEEQIDGVRGGAKTRVYQGDNSQIQTNDRLAETAKYYLATGEPVAPSGNLYAPLTSSYRLPLVVMDIALDREGRGVYEIKQRRMGLVEPGYYAPPDYRMRTDFGGLLRYSYCTPDFIMGSLMMDARPLEDWAMISSQNRWQGVIFRGHKNARIYPQCLAAADRKTLNQQWAVQRGGTMIVQKLDAERFGRRAREMRVWLAGDGLANRKEQGGWVFVEAEGAFAAVRPAWGGYQLSTEPEKNRGTWLICDEDLSPVILEVVRKSDVEDYGAFRRRILARGMSVEEQVLTYEGLAGDRFVFYGDYTKRPEINGRPVDLAPPRVFDSPFVTAEWDRGVVTVQKGSRRLLLDFNRP